MMEEDVTRPTDDPDQISYQQVNPKAGSRDLVRLLKQIIISPEIGKHLNPKVISSRFYNCFNYFSNSRDQKDVHLTVGITSANPGEGKTLVASNLAVSVALGNERKTVLVDLNARSPHLHHIFGTNLSPGLVEALDDTTIQVSQTQIKHLHVLSAGDISDSRLTASRTALAKDGISGLAGKRGLGLQHVAAFRDVLYSLRQEYEFIIVDTPAILGPLFPPLLLHQMDGLLVVVDSDRTKHGDIQKIFLRVNEDKIVGFVYNRTSDELLS